MSVIVVSRDVWAKAQRGSPLVLAAAQRTYTGDSHRVASHLVYNDTWPQRWKPSLLVINIAPAVVPPLPSLRHAQFFVDQSTTVVQHSSQVTPNGSASYTILVTPQFWCRWFGPAEQFNQPYKPAPRLITDAGASLVQYNLLKGHDVEGWPPEPFVWSPGQPQYISAINVFPSYPYARDMFLRKKQAQVFGEPELQWLPWRPLARSITDTYAAAYDVTRLRLQAKFFSEPEIQWSARSPLSISLMPQNIYNSATDPIFRRPQAKWFAEPDIQWRATPNFWPSVLSTPIRPPYSSATAPRWQTFSRWFVPAEDWNVSYRVTGLVINSESGPTPPPPASFTVVVQGSSRVIFYPKLVGEQLLVPADFISRLSSGEVILSATVTSSVYSGIDPIGLTIGPPGVNNTVVEAEISGGVAGVIYVLVYTAITSLGQELVLAGYYAVEQNVI